MNMAIILTVIDGEDYDMYARLWLWNSPVSKVVCSCPRERPPVRRGEDRTDDLRRGQTPPDGSYVGPSSCNDYTDSLGSGQNVLSYSYYTPGTTAQGETWGGQMDINSTLQSTPWCL